MITDINGNVVQHLEYIPFGEVFIDERPSAGSWSSPYKFNAKELDEETGLYYYGARYYDPRTSVWISSDPLAEKYPNMSSYVYCAENPVKFIDPDGRKIYTWEVKKDDQSGQPSYTNNSISKNVNSAFKGFFTSPTGAKFFSRFAKNGDVIGTTKFVGGSGDFSGVDFKILDNSYSDENNINLITDKSAAISLDIIDGKPVVVLTIDSKGHTPESIIEDIDHETQDHGYSIFDEINAFTKGGIGALNKLRIGKEDKDHKALRDKDMNHPGYRNYQKVANDLLKKIKGFSNVLKDAEQKYKENYKDIK